MAAITAENIDVPTPVIVTSGTVVIDSGVEVIHRPANLSGVKTLASITDDGGANVAVVSLPSLDSLAPTAYHTLTVIGLNYGYDAKGDRWQRLRVNKSGQGALTVATSGIDTISVTSGVGALISGQTVDLASGVEIMSGVGVLISGQMTQLASGYTMKLASGQFIIISGQGVRIQSGAGVLISGQMVQTASGLYIYSGIGTLISGQTIDLKSGLSIENITHSQAHIHEGIRYAATDYDASIDETSGAEKIWMITTPDTTARVHLEWDVGVDNEALIELRENPTVVSAGTAIIVYNKDRNSTNSATTLVYKDVGVSYGTGTPLVYLKTGAAGQKEHVGGEGWSGNWILKQNEDYVIVVTPNNAATGASMIMKWDEE